MGAKRGQRKRPDKTREKVFKRALLTTLRPVLLEPEAPAEAGHKPFRPTQTREQLDPQESTHQGLKGYYERLLRRFKTAVHVATLVPLYLLSSIIIGLALTPGLFLVWQVYQWTEPWVLAARIPLLAISISAAYFVYGFSLLCILPLVNALFGARLTAWRGPYYSIQCVPWYIHNGLTYLARYTFLEFVTPTPFSNLFYSCMGMKIGRGAQINTTNISDPSLIEIGEKVTIGGSATIIAHYAMGGFLVMAPVKIGAGATIGLKATIMGGVEIGEGAKIMPNSVVLPRTKVPAGETWGGVPARRIDLRKAA